MIKDHRTSVNKPLFRNSVTYGLFTVWRFAQHFDVDGAIAAAGVAVAAELPERAAVGEGRFAM